MKRIHGGWDNVQSFNIKTNSSVSLPVWSCNFGSGEDARWPEALEEEKAADTTIPNEDEVGTGLGDEKEGSEEAVQKTTKAKGKRKAVEVDVEEAPVKKAKKERKSKEGKLAKSTKPVAPAAETPSAVGKQSKKVEDEVSEESKKKSFEEAPLKPVEGRKSRRSKDKTLSKVADTTAKPPALKPKATAEKSKITDTSAESPTSKPKASPKKPKASSPDAPKETSTDITPAELKKKRSAKGIEKKKEVVTKRKTGAAKKEILGKNAKVRF